MKESSFLSKTLLLLWMILLTWTTSGSSFIEEFQGPWIDEVDSAVYLMFYPLYEGYKYEFYNQENLIDSGTLYIQGNDLKFASENGNITYGVKINDCKFEWGNIGIFKSSNCVSDYTDPPPPISPPMEECDPININILSPISGTISLEGTSCSERGLSGSLIYKNFTMAGTFSPIIINGEISISIYPLEEEEFPQKLSWEMSGTANYEFVDFGNFPIFFDNVKFITDIFHRPLEAYGYFYIDNTAYPATRDMLFIILGMY